MPQPSKIIVDDRPMPTVPGRQLADHRLLEESPNSSDFNSGVPTHVPGAEPSGDALARQLNGSLMALLLYMGEIKQQSDKIAQTRTERRYLQAIVDNAVEQTERVCALVRQISGSHVPSTTGRSRSADQNAAGGASMPSVPAPVARQQRPLTPREREVLQLISEGYSNKQGALRMRISPRTFESHRAEAMRKLGARNTAELVRAALLQALD
ncbi:helix-turn-helix domain-containing protein [Bradyrhizobium sp. HKCCYLS1011]|uniref:helix-turn-helix domain-containing protein n=1 Tax=Bradyrhizobium sp. HKCCYLS1011 TaxID=3420733 RepID=UPI003EBB2488